MFNEYAINEDIWAEEQAVYTDDVALIEAEFIWLIENLFLFFD